MTLITFQLFDNYIDAHIARVKLESEDIQCFIFDENTVALNPLFATAIGGIKLKIRPADFERAVALTGAINRGEFQDAQEAIKCPKCSSKDLISGLKRIKGLKGITSMVISFISMTYPLYFETVYKCKDCGTEFKNHNFEKE